MGWVQRHQQQGRDHRNRHRLPQQGLQGAAMAGQAGTGRQAEQEGQCRGAAAQEPLAQPQRRSQGHQHPHGGDEGCTRERQGQFPPHHKAAQSPHQPTERQQQGQPIAPGPAALDRQQHQGHQEQQVEGLQHQPRHAIAPRPQAGGHQMGQGQASQG